MREFLLDRGIPAGSPEALRHFSARLALDPSFQRDITSLLHVVIWREDQAVDYMDLLGILVAAAAGPGPLRVTEEQEEVVRELLRFLTQVRRPPGSVAPVFVRSENVVPPALAALPVAPESVSTAVSTTRDVVNFAASSLRPAHAEEPQPLRSGGVIRIAAAVAIALVLGSAWMLHQKSRTAPQNSAAPENTQSASAPVTEQDNFAASPAISARKLAGPSARRLAPTATRQSAPFRTRRIQPDISERWSSMPHVPPLNAQHLTPPLKSLSPVQPAVNTGPVSAAKTFNAVPENAAKSQPPVTPTTSTSPFVRRQLPKVVVINPAPPHRSNGFGSPSTSEPGLVHPASIGMMASNLISSPAPAYPIAASQARVQGEVTVRAIVNREGNVIDARVVSGPDLLRDASLKAVQQWRYRPYIQGGKPVEVATTAVLDFELP